MTLLVSVQLNNELRADLKETMVQKYQQPGQEHITRAVDKLQQDVRGLTVHVRGIYEYSFTLNILCTFLKYSVVMKEGKVGSV